MAKKEKEEEEKGKLDFSWMKDFDKKGGQEKRKRGGRR